jgi:hypothetical protein
VAAKLEFLIAWVRGSANAGEALEELADAVVKDWRQKRLQVGGYMILLLSDMIAIVMCYSGPVTNIHCSIFIN